MPYLKTLTSFLLLGTCLLAPGCARTRAMNHVDRAALLEAVRQYGKNRQQGQAVSTTPAVERTTQSPSGSDTEEAYKREIMSYFLDKNFAQLDKAARDARTEKERFPGGVWKLYTFYTGLSTPTLGDQATDADWNYHIGVLKEWASARPDSAVARIALAETYISYSDKARGTGYANTVSVTGWKLSAERTAEAASILVEAERLTEKCPFWYEAMQQVALGQGWERDQARELFEQAIAFQPDYYHFYREYAYYLLPKWYGEPGDAQKFAEEISNRVGGAEGKFLYFEIASQITCQCDSPESEIETLSWPKIKEGYVALGQLYCYSNLKLNRFAHMAVEAGDKPAAAEAFAKIGDDWDHTVWRSNQRFEQGRKWAMGL